MLRPPMPNKYVLQPKINFLEMAHTNFVSFMAPRWHQGTTAPRALKKNTKELGGNAQKQILVLSALYGPRGHGSMREPLEMFTASLMQNMVQIRKKNMYFATKLLFGILEKVLLGLSASRAPTVGPSFIRKTAYQP